MSLQPPPTTITLEAALRDLGARSPRARAQAAHALGDLTDPDDRRRASAALLEIADDPKPEVRVEVAVSLGELAEESAVPGLIALLDDRVPVVRQGAAIALGKLGFRAGFDALAGKLADGPADLRFQAATSLAEIDPDAAYQPLVAALGDGDAEVAGAAAVALGAIGDPRAAGHLARLLDHDSARTRFDAAYALSELADPRGRAALAAALTDPASGWDAVEALERLADPAIADDLAILVADRRKVGLVEVRAAAAILRLSPDGDHAAAARSLLEEAVGARKLEVAGLAVEQLAAVGGRWAAGVLERARTSRRGRRLADEIDRALEDLPKGPE